MNGPLDNWKRAEVARFGWKQAGDVDATYKQVAKMANVMYDIGSEDDLIGRIREGLGRFPAKQKGDNGYGMRYEVRMEIEGRNSRTAKIITAWIDDNKTKEMRLVSAYVDKEKRRGK